MCVLVVFVWWRSLACVEPFVIVHDRTQFSVRLVQDILRCSARGTRWKSCCAPMLIMPTLCFSLQRDIIPHSCLLRCFLMGCDSGRHLARELLLHLRQAQPLARLFTWGLPLERLPKLRRARPVSLELCVVRQLPYHPRLPPKSPRALTYF